MGKKVIISETQYKMLETYLTESYDYQTLVEKIVEDLNKNYKKALETYEDKIAGDYNQRQVFEINVTGEIIDPLNLREYMQKKYNVGKKFMEQLLNDWCDGKIKNGFLSRDISSNE